MYIYSIKSDKPGQQQNKQKISQNLRSSVKHADLPYDSTDVTWRLGLSMQVIVGSFMRQKTRYKNKVQLRSGESILTDAEVANILLQEFKQNFSHCDTFTDSTIYSPVKEDCTKLQVNCIPTMVLEVLQKRPSTKNSPDGISFRLLKSVAKYIITPLCIIC